MHLRVLLERVAPGQRAPCSSRCTFLARLPSRGRLAGCPLTGLGEGAPWWPGCEGRANLSGHLEAVAGGGCPSAGRWLPLAPKSGFAAKVCLSSSELWLGPNKGVFFWGGCLVHNCTGKAKPPRSEAGYLLNPHCWEQTAGEGLPPPMASQEHLVIRGMWVDWGSPPGCPGCCSCSSLLLVWNSPQVLLWPLEWSGWWCLLWVLCLSWPGKEDPQACQDRWALGPLKPLGCLLRGVWLGLGAFPPARGAPADPQG